MLKILTALICIISFGCGNLKSQSKEDSEIQEFIIDELAVAYPLPSPRKHPNLTKKDWDSINKIPTTIIINPIMLSTEIKKKYSNNSGYMDLIHSLNKLMRDPNNRLDKNLKSHEGHKIIYGKSLDLLEGKYKQLISFSPIAYNYYHTRAAIIVAYSNTNLSGFTNLYFLRKRNKKWEIEEKINLSKS